MRPRADDGERVILISWAVSQCGTMQVEGLPVWKNVCKGWIELKKKLLPSKPNNLDDWGNLPLWRPHMNHVDPKIVRCSTITQRLLKNHGFNFMADVWTAANGFVTWQEAIVRGAPLRCENAFMALIHNLKAIPEVAHPDSLQDLYLQGADGPDQHLVWLFRLPASQASARWIPFLNRGVPEKTFQLVGSRLMPIANRGPNQQVGLRRIVVRAPSHSNLKIVVGSWIRETLLCTQYRWQDGTLLLNSSTAQLRILQIRE